MIADGAGTAMLVARCARPPQLRHNRTKAFDADMRSRFIVFGLLLAAPLYAAPKGRLKVRIFDVDGKTEVPARVSVIGADHAFYAPAADALAEYSLKRK